MFYNSEYNANNLSAVVKDAISLLKKYKTSLSD